MNLTDIPAADGTTEAYVARPASGTGPGVLLFMDAFGLRPRIADMCDRIASWGYVVMAPNLFYRSGTVKEVAPVHDLRDPAVRGDAFKLAMPRMQRLTPERTFADVDAYVAALRALPGVSAGPIGTTGYCMGARWSTYAGTRHRDDVAVVAGFHGGRLATDDEFSPHRGIPGTNADYVYLHADKDASMGPEAVQLLEDTLQAAGVAHLNEIAPGAPHGYTMADTASYDRDAAERAFTELQAALARRLSA